MVTFSLGTSQDRVAGCNGAYSLISKSGDASVPVSADSPGNSVTSVSYTHLTLPTSDLV